MNQHTVDITLALPAYNEEGNIERVIAESRKALECTGRTWEILVIDNASNDTTPALVRAEEQADARIRLIVHETNRFYSGSCATALREGRGTFCMIMDSDGQFTARDLPAFLQKLDEGYDFVMGWRRQRNDPFMRILSSALFNAMGKFWLNYPGHDLNCGIRMFNRKVIESAVIRHTINMANPELYARARAAGLRFAEVEVHHYDRVAGATSHDFARSLRLLMDVNRYMKALNREIKGGGVRS